MVRLILFDIDSTLLLTNHVGIHAFEKTLETQFNVTNGTHGIVFSGRTDTGLVRELFLKHRIPITPENFQQFYDCYAHLLAEMLPDCNGEICAGAGELIEELQALPQPPTLGLLTGNLRIGAELKLRHFQLWEHFITGAFAEDHEDRNKIAAAAYVRGKEILGKNLLGSEIVVIGDTHHDINCGRAIGAKVLAVATGSSSVVELNVLQPDWAVEDLTRLRAQDICPR